MAALIKRVFTKYKAYEIVHPKLIVDIISISLGTNVSHNFSWEEINKCAYIPDRHNVIKKNIILFIWFGEHMNLFWLFIKSWVISKNMRDMGNCFTEKSIQHR